MHKDAIPFINKEIHGNVGNLNLLRSPLKSRMPKSFLIATRIHPIKRTVLNNHIPFLLPCLESNIQFCSVCDSLHRDRHSLGGAVIQMFDKTPATEKFPNGALYRANTVLQTKPLS